MSNNTRKRHWPAATALSFAVVGVVAALVVLAVYQPGLVSAHGPGGVLTAPNVCHSALAFTNPACGGQHTDHAPNAEPGTTTPPDTTVPPVPGGGNGGSGSGELASGDNARPGKPINLRATADGPTIIKLDWDAAEGGGGATGYRIDISEDGMKWEEFVHNTGNSTTQYLHKGLVAQEMHYYRVFGVNSVDTGYASATVTGQSAESHKPEAPENLEAEADPGVDHDNDADTENIATVEEHLVINLEWQAPPDPVGAPVNAYQIEVSVDGERWRDFAVDKEIEDSSTQTFSAAVRFGEETRYYRVSAMNKLDPDGTPGESGPSNTAYDTTVPGDVPGQVTGLRAGVQPTSNDVWLYWDKMNTPRGTIPDDFRARIEATMLGTVGMDDQTAASLLGRGTTIADDATWSPVESISWSVDYEAAEEEMNRARITVGANQVWAFRVIANNKFGDADASAPVRAIMGSELAPRNPRLQNVRSDDAEHDGRSGLQLTWRSTTNNTVNPLQVITADDTNASDADDTVHNDYAVEYRIEVSEDGVEWKQLVVAEENINATPAGKDTVDEDATLDGNVEPVDTDDADTERNYDSTEQKFTQRQLAASTEKYYRIFAFTRSDTTSDTSPLIMSVPSDERDGSTDEPLHPGRTRNLEALASGRTTIDLTWERPEVTDDGCVVDDTDAAREDDGSECPADSAGSVITGYQIQVSDNGTSGWTNLAVDTCVVLDKDGDPVKPRTMESPRCMYTHTGLVPDTTKYYRVFAMNVAGDGPLSNTALDTTHLSEFPDVPGGLTGDPYGATAVKLCWLAQSLDPADDPVMSYEITVSGMDDPIMVMATTMGDPVPTQHMITGLNAETKYTFKVRAVNLRGKSNQAATETVTTGMAPSEPPSTELTMPTMVEVMGGVGALTVTWEDGENAVGHLVLLLDSDFDLVMTETAPTGNSHTFSPLAAGQYTAVVVSYKSVSDYEYDHATSTVN